MAEQVIALQESFKLFRWTSLCCDTGVTVGIHCICFKAMLSQYQTTEIPVLHFKPTGSLLLKPNMRKQKKEKKREKTAKKTPKTKPTVRGSFLSFEVSVTRRNRPGDRISKMVSKQ